MCDTGDLPLCNIGAAAMWMCDWNFNILRPVTFMMELWANSS
jgi:hypothetical protein